MRTLVLTEHFLPSVGGSINWLINTYSRYPRDEVILVAPQAACADASDRTLPFRVERTPMQMADWDPTLPSSCYRYLGLIWRVSRFCSKYHIRQIHCAKVLPEGLVAYWIDFLQHIPYLVYAHGEELQFGATSSKLRWLMPRIYNHARGIIANSTNTKLLLANLGIQPQKIHVVHPGVDTNRFRCYDGAGTAIRQRFDLAQNRVILTVGRLQRRKGHDMVIEALPVIKRRFPQIKYLIVGDGEERSYLRQLSVNIGVSESVIFAGRVTDEELPHYYAACDIFIMPSRAVNGDIEGFGIVYLEAAAAGKPVIGGRSGGTEDAILDGVTGLRVDGNSAAEIAAAVIDLLSDPQKAQAFGEAGYCRAAADFTWDVVAQRTLALSLTL